MRVRVLGCHHTETATARLSSYLVNDCLALDAGSLSSTLTQKEQDQLQGILVTHKHFDHCRDLLTIGLGGLDTGISLPVYGTIQTLSELREHLLNGKVYPNFTTRPSLAQPRLKLSPLEPWKEHTIAGLQVTPLPMDHGVPAWGFYLQAQTGGSLLYTGDTGGRLHRLWHDFSPDLLLIEVTYPNDQETLARTTHHLTPKLLETELQKLLEIKGSAPRVVPVHMHTRTEGQIVEELQKVSNRLGIPITPGYEGMTLQV